MVGVLTLIALLAFPFEPTAYSQADPAPCSDNFARLLSENHSDFGKASLTDKELLSKLRSKLEILEYDDETPNSNKLRRLEKILNWRIEKLAKRGLTSQERDIFSTLAERNTPITWNLDSDVSFAEPTSNVVHVGGKWIRGYDQLSIYETFLHEGAHIRDYVKTPHFLNHIVERLAKSEVINYPVISVWQEILANYAAKGSIEDSLRISKHYYKDEFDLVNSLFPKEGVESLSPLEQFKFYKRNAEGEAYKLIQITRYLQVNGHGGKIQGLLREANVAYDLNQFEKKYEDKFPKADPTWVKQKAEYLLAHWKRYPKGFKGASTPPGNGH
ncbi:MAG: hypothetical protein EOP04_01970 [Proteobacteria bacterium]|nr:MAG: hypothetical protein EOP04_01970 [Pseudomonadota bacterium]